MLAELDREKASIQNEGVSFVQNLKSQKVEVEQKIDRLLDIYIEGKGISPDEYQAKKAKLLGEKADIDQEIRDFEQKGNNWLEPMREVILLSSQAQNSFVAGRQNANPRISQKCRLELYEGQKRAFLEENQKICYHTLIGNIVAYFYAIKIWILWQLLAKI